MVFPAFGRRDRDVTAAGARHFAGLLERRFGRLPAVNKIAMLAHRFDRKAHFFFFFLFFLMISAWILKACASVLIWLATTASAVFMATRSAVAACCRIAFAIFMPVNFPAVPWFQQQPDHAVSLIFPLAACLQKPITSSLPAASVPSSTTPEFAVARRSHRS
jgi:hypothetical protein